METAARAYPIDQARSIGAPDDLLTSAGVEVAMGGVSQMTVWRWTQYRGFPLPDLVIARRKFWRRSTIQAWIATQMDKGNAA